MHTEGIWSGGVPSAITSGVVTFVGLSSLKTFKTNAKAIALGASVIGYFIGRITYSQKCLEKVLALPNSTLKDQVEGIKRFQRF